VNTVDTKEPELATIGVEEMRAIRRGLNSVTHLLDVLDAYFSAERDQQTVSKLIALRLLCRLSIDEALRMTERATIRRD
jgi:hypothetical protein